MFSVDFRVPIPEGKGKIFERTIKGVTYINYEYDRIYKPDKKVLCMLSDCIQVSSPDSVVAPATQGRPLDDRNHFRLCNQYLSASDGNCFGTWNYPVAQITACTIPHSSYHHHKSYGFIVSAFRYSCFS